RAARGICGRLHLHPLRAVRPGAGQRLHQIRDLDPRLHLPRTRGVLPVALRPRPCGAQRDEFRRAGQGRRGRQAAAPGPAPLRPPARPPAPRRDRVGVAWGRPPPPPGGGGGGGGGGTTGATSSKVTSLSTATARAHSGAVEGATALKPERAPSPTEALENLP